MFHASTETIIRRMITTNCNIDRQLIIVWLRHYADCAFNLNYKYLARAYLKLRALNLFLWRHLANNSVLLFNVFVYIHTYIDFNKYSLKGFSIPNHRLKTEIKINVKNVKIGLSISFHTNLWSPSDGCKAC